MERRMYCMIYYREHRTCNLRYYFDVYSMKYETFNWHACAQSRLPACTRRLNEVHGGRRRILLDGFNDFPPGALHTQRTWMLTQTDACLSRHPTHGLRRVDDGPNRRMVNGSTVASIRVDGMLHSEKKLTSPQTGRQRTALKKRQQRAGHDINS